MGHLLALQDIHSSVVSQPGPFQVAVEPFAGLLAVVLLIVVAVRVEGWLDREADDVTDRCTDPSEGGTRSGREWWTRYGSAAIVLALLAAEVGLLVRVADWV